MENLLKYQELSREALTKNPHMIVGDATEDEKQHIVQIGASVMMTRDKYIRGGSFVEAIIHNDLNDALNRADSTCLKALKFFSYVNKYRYLNREYA